MAHYVEPMDIDDDKENSFDNYSSVQKTPNAEKSYNELDTSEINMKLRMSCTPMSSPMSRTLTGSSRKMLFASGDYNMNSSVQNMSLDSSMTYDTSENTQNSQNTTLFNSQYGDTNGNETVVCENNLNATYSHENTINNNVTVTLDAENNGSTEFTSPPLYSSPIPTTPTKELPKMSTSPIMRGLKSVLSMFRPSQSPITADISINEQFDCVDNKQNNLNHDLKDESQAASTPVSGRKIANVHLDTLVHNLSDDDLASSVVTDKKPPKSICTNSMSPLKQDSLVYTEDFVNDLQWNKDTTILFNEDKIPLRKLYTLNPGTQEITRDENIGQNNEEREICESPSFVEANDGFSDLEDGQTKSENKAEFFDCDDKDNETPAENCNVIFTNENADNQSVNNEISDSEINITANIMTKELKMPSMNKSVKEQTNSLADEKTVLNNEQLISNTKDLVDEEANSPQEFQKTESYTETLNRTVTAENTTFHLSETNQDHIKQGNDLSIEKNITPFETSCVTETKLDSVETPKNRQFQDIIEAKTPIQEMTSIATQLASLILPVISDQYLGIDQQLRENETVDSNNLEKPTDYVHINNDIPLDESIHIPPDTVIGTASIASELAEENHQVINATDTTTLDNDITLLSKSLSVVQPDIDLVQNQTRVSSTQDKTEMTSKSIETELQPEMIEVDISQDEKETISQGVQNTSAYNEISPKENLPVFDNISLCEEVTEIKYIKSEAVPKPATVANNDRSSPKTTLEGKQAENVQNTDLPMNKEKIIIEVPSLEDLSFKALEFNDAKTLETPNMQDSLDDITKSLEDEIITSENNSPYVSLNSPTENIKKINEIENEPKFSDVKDPFATQTKIRLSPPLPAKKGFNFNDIDFEAIDNPFATKTNIRMSPPLANISQTSEDTFKLSQKNKSSQKNTRTRGKDKFSQSPKVNKYDHARTNTIAYMDEKSNENETVIDSLNKTNEISNDSQDAQFNETVNILTSHPNNNDIQSPNDNNLKSNSNSPNDIQDLTVKSIHSDSQKPGVNNILLSENESKVKQAVENVQTETLFINADEFDILLQQNNDNFVDIRGKESLFLKFDPLCASTGDADKIATVFQVNEQSEDVSVVLPANDELQNFKGIEQSLYITADNSSVEQSQDLDIEIQNITQDMENPFNTKPKLRNSPLEATFTKELNETVSIVETVQKIDDSTKLKDAFSKDIGNPFYTKSKLRQSPIPTLETTFTEDISDKMSSTFVKVTDTFSMDPADVEEPESTFVITPQKDIVIKVDDDIPTETPSNVFVKETQNKNVIEHQQDKPEATTETLSCTFIKTETDQNHIPKTTNETESDHIDKETFNDSTMSSESSKSDHDVNTTVMEVNTEDEDTLEGPFDIEEKKFESQANESDNDTQKERFLEACAGKVSEWNLKATTSSDQRILEQGGEEAFQPGEVFINADTFDFLMNQNINNDMNECGKKSLFLKFDPLCANLVNSDGVMKVLDQTQKDVETVEPKKPSTPDSLNRKDLNSTFEISSNITIETDSEINRSQMIEKPMMAVMPAVSNGTISTPRSGQAPRNVQTPRNQSTPRNMASVPRSVAHTPNNRTRQSMNYTSPAIAAIDRLISLSSNQTPVNLSHGGIDAVMQLRGLLTEREEQIHQLKVEGNQLRDRLTSLEIQMKTLEDENSDKIKKVDDLTAKLTEKSKMNAKMATVVEDYERTIATLIGNREQERKKHEEEKAKLIMERDEQTAHLASMEVSFNDLHSKYEKSKQVIAGYKTNEDLLRKSIQESEANFNKMVENYESLKQHATSKLNQSNIELEKMKKSHETEILKLTAIIKRKDLHCSSLEESLAQKSKANEELTAICDELISKVTT